MKPLLALFTEETFFEQEVELLKAMLKNGLQRLHVRKPDASEAELDSFLGSFSEAERKKMVTHSFPELASRRGLFGAHATSKLREVGNKEPFVSASFHTAEELERVDGQYKYLFVSPVFQSISKTGYGPMEREPVLEMLSHMITPVLALGGITMSTIAQALAWGFSGIGVLGAVWKAHDPVSELKRMQELLDRLSDEGAIDKSSPATFGSQSRQPYIRL